MAATRALVLFAHGARFGTGDRGGNAREERAITAAVLDLELCTLDLGDIELVVIVEVADLDVADLGSATGVIADTRLEASVAVVILRHLRRS